MRHWSDQPDLDAYSLAAGMNPQPVVNQFKTRDDGDWHAQDTWEGGVLPTDKSDVVIDHRVVVRRKTPILRTCEFTDRGKLIEVCYPGVQCYPKESVQQ